MARTYDHIIGPKEGHAHQGVKTADDYLRVQAGYLASNRAAGVDDAVPHEATDRERAQASAPYVNLGQWVMNCACNNAPSVSFEWDLACCLECGAIYRSLWVPIERSRIELARWQLEAAWTPPEPQQRKPLRWRWYHVALVPVAALVLVVRWVRREVVGL